jgi:CRP/FNR family transcriptional regulator, cyclic AMP receptor protein
VSVTSGTATRCHVLREDQDLAAAIPAERRARAIEECVARELVLSQGGWDGPGMAISSRATGLVVLEGMLIRRAGIEQRFGAELLGEGDVLRPWQGEPEASTTLPVTISWSALEPCRMAVLDDEFLPHLSRYPELAGCLLSRVIQRARNLCVQLAIVHQARVDTRLHLLFWHLAARWGRVRSDATILPLRLTHSVLADLVAARRPTVTSALSDLARRGLLRYADDVWVLSGDPPGTLLQDVSGNGQGVA